MFAKGESLHIKPIKLSKANKSIIITYKKQEAKKSEDKGNPNIDGFWISVYLSQNQKVKYLLG